MSDTRDGITEAIMIAEGRSRAEVEQRARTAFAAANDIRARYQSILDVEKRGMAVSRARTWADILCHMDRTGEPVFCGDPWDNSLRARLAVWRGVAEFVQAWRDIVGTSPVTFYEFPGDGA